MNKDFIDEINIISKKEYDKILKAREAGDRMILRIKNILANNNPDKEFITYILSFLKTLNENAICLSKMYSSHSEDFKFLISVCENKIKEQEDTNE